MQPPLISVIIPTFNYEQFVSAAIDSVLAQTYRDREVIVVDDGSTDSTAKRLAPYGSRIRYIYQSNQGLSAARNAGIRASRGDWIALLDSDDLWHPCKLEIQAAYLARHPEVGMLACEHVTDLNRGWPEIAASTTIPEEIVSLEGLAIKCRFGPSGTLIRRQCFDDVGTFDTSLRSVEDRDMWLRIAARYQIVKLSAPLWYYRLHHTNMSYNAERMESNELRVLRRAFTTLPGLQRRHMLKRKAHSYCLYTSAYMYLTLGQPMAAALRLMKSFATYPLPYRRAEVRTRWARAKMLTVAVGAVLRTGLVHLR
jgi:glycosyltransferase involved in cell wall biosynthesis